MKKIIGFVLILFLSGCLKESSTINIEPQNGQVYPLKLKPSTASFREQVAYQRAFEATLWFQPANSYEQFRKAFFSLPNMSNNVVASYSNPIGQNTQAITGNTVTNYIVAFSDLKDGPVVLEIPAKNEKASLYGQVVDAWQFTIADVGPNGQDKGNGGKYLFIPPGYSGEIPDGVFPIQSSTYKFGLVFRSVQGPKGSKKYAYEYTKLINMYPMDMIGNPPEPKNIDPSDNIIPTLPIYDYDLIEVMHTFINYEPVKEHDKIMLGMISSLGIEKNKPLAVDKALIPSIKRGIQDAFFYMQELTEKRHKKKLYWEDRHWSFVMIPDEKDQFDFILETKIDIDNRAASWNFFTFYPTTLNMNNLGTVYLAPIQDSLGNDLVAGATYKLTVQKDVPVNQFWSLTLYDSNTYSFIINPQDKHGLSSLDDLVQNSDGTYDIYIGPKSPTGKEKNWLPTMNKKPYLWFRFYSPKESFYNKSFKLNDLERID